MARRNKKQDNEQLWDLDNELESPVAVSNSIKKRRRRAKFFYAYAVTSCVLFPFATIASMNGWVTAAQATKAPVTTVSTSSPAKGPATKAVTDWLHSTPAPVPGGSVQSWDSFKSIPVPPSTDGKPVPTYEIHNFTIISETGRLYHSSIQMAYSDTAGVQVVGAPSLIPFAPDGNNSISTTTPWPGHEPFPITNGVKDAVNVWAAAYTGGNPSALRQTVGDPDAGHAYVPFAGIQKSSNVNVVAVAGKFTDAEKSESTKNPAQVVARVTIEVLWVGQSSKDGAANSKLTYDVLVNNANTGSPSVVAWGGPGEGFDIAPYSNALVGREVAVDDTLNKKLSTISPATPQDTAPVPTASADTTSQKAGTSR